MILVTIRHNSCPVAPVSGVTMSEIIWWWVSPRSSILLSPGPGAGASVITGAQMWGLRVCRSRPGPTEVYSVYTQSWEENAFHLKILLCQSEHQRLHRLDQSPTENDIFYFGQMTCSDCARAGCLMIPLCSPCSGQFKLSVIMMLAPAPDGPELWKLF